VMVMMTMMMMMLMMMMNNQALRTEFCEWYSKYIV
jgi:hypothetical protein